jgi:hypothetical protein
VTAAETRPAAGTDDATAVAPVPHARPEPAGVIMGTARALGIYAASRVATVVAMATAAVISPEYALRDIFFRWDGRWYLATADTGYPHAVLPPAPVQGDAQSTLAFFPGYPLAIRTLRSATGLSTRQAGLLLAVAFGATAAALLWWLVRRLVDAASADRATALFCFFPGSFVLTMVYAEGLMISLALACLLALISRRWLLAGVAAGLATAVRPNALALVAACGWEAARALRRKEWRAVAAPLLAPAGLVAFFTFLRARTGTVSAWFDTEARGWGEHFDFGVSTWHKFGRVVRDPTGDMNEVLATLGLVFLVAAGYLLIRSRLPSVLTVYTAGVAVLAVGSQILGPRPRFILAAFPLLVAVGVRTRGLVFSVVLATSATLLAALTVVSLTTNWAIP